MTETLRPVEFEIILSVGHNPVGAIIRKATHSDLSHAVIRRIDARTDMVLEAWGGHRCSMRPYDVFLDRKATVLYRYRVLWDEGQLEAAWASCAADFCDENYPWLQLAGNLVPIVLDKIAPRTRHRNPFAARTVVCSELVLIWLRRAGLKGFGHLDQNRVSPQDLFAVCNTDPRGQFQQVL